MLGLNARNKKLSAGIEREMWGGETVVFCHLHKQLWQEEGDKTLLLCMGPASLEEILSMKKALPQHQVRRAI